jgi:hypothetical protein
MVWYSEVWFGLVYGMWYGLVWYGLVWYGMVWYGMVWYGMVWYGIDWWHSMVWCIYFPQLLLHGLRRILHLQKPLYVLLLSNEKPQNLDRSVEQ